MCTLSLLLLKGDLRLSVGERPQGKQLGFEMQQLSNLQVNLLDFQQMTMLSRPP
jgi:hypothetical protein